MELISVPLARIVSFLEVQGMDPSGRASTPETLAMIRDRLSFSVFPTTFEKIDLRKGVDLQFGRLDRISIDKLTVYANALSIDTHSSTDDSLKVLENLLAFAHDAFGATIRPNRTVFLNHVLFRTEKKLFSVNPALQEIADEVSASVSSDLGTSVPFEPSTIHLGPDLSKTKITVSAFSVERRQDVPFSEDIYFSSAPLRTSHHIALLERFDKLLR
jgi:hypothetical protein